MSARALDYLIVIPARFGSTRFHGKPLARLRNAQGIEKPLIEWSWRAGVAAGGENRVVIATDDERIASAARSFGAEVIMTSPDLLNGTERCAAVVAAMEVEPEIVINLQGDSPLVPPSYVAALIDRAQASEADMITPYVECDAALAKRLLDQHAAGTIGGTFVVTRADGSALYFSKRPIPFGAELSGGLKLHVGLYAYKATALAKYANLSPCAAELSEGLEQLRFLDAGMRVDMIWMELPETGLWELNNPEDVAIVEAGLPVSL